MSNPQSNMRPKAVVQGKIDKTRSHMEKLVEYPLLSTTNFTENGSAFVWTSESGVDQQVVAVSAGSANELFAGVGFSDFRRLTNFVEVEQKTIPSVAPYQAQLKKGSNVIAGSFFIQDSSGNVFTNTSPLAASTTEYAVDANGLVTFNSADAGKVVTIRYRYTITNVELNSRFPQPAYVQQGQTFLAQVAIAVGYCEIYTTQYNTANTFTLQGRVYTGAGGVFTTTSTAVMVAGRCISLPSIGDPFLGIAYQVGTTQAWA